MLRFVRWQAGAAVVTGRGNEPILTGRWGVGRGAYACCLRPDHSSAGNSGYARAKQASRAGWWRAGGLQSVCWLSDSTAGSRAGPVNGGFEGPAAIRYPLLELYVLNEQPSIHAKCIPVTTPSLLPHAVLP